jgi:hypothetical protein
MRMAKASLHFPIPWILFAPECADFSGQRPAGASAGSPRAPLFAGCKNMDGFIPAFLCGNE